MALTISDVHQRMNFLIKKNKWGYTSPQEIDLCLDMAQVELFNFYYGEPNHYQVGRPVPPVAYSQTKKIHDSLKQFVKPWTLTGADGFNEFPSDYVHLDSAYIIDSSTDPESYYPLKFVTNDKIAFKQNSQLKPVVIGSDFSHAFISITPNPAGDFGLQIYPREAPNPEVPIAYYLGMPTPPVYSYTQVGRTITWVEGSSTALNWQDDDILKIIERAIQYIGIALEDDRLFQEGQTKAKE